MKIGREAIALGVVTGVMIGGMLSGCGDNGFFLKEESSIPDGAIKLEASVEEVYGNTSLEDALEERKSLVSTHLGNLASLLSGLFE